MLLAPLAWLEGLGAAHVACEYVAGVEVAHVVCTTRSTVRVIVYVVPSVVACAEAPTVAARAAVVKVEKRMWVGGFSESEAVFWKR
jgi:hypothetical protein